MSKSDPINAPTHYTSHPSGVECIEIVEWMPFNLGNAWKYLHRQDLKGSPVQDMQKAQWYIRREIRRRGIAARQGLIREARHTQAVFSKVSRFLKHESGLRREIFSELWHAFQHADNTASLVVADNLLRELVGKSETPRFPSPRPITLSPRFNL